MVLKRKDKVLFIVPSLSPSGAELFFYRLSKEFNSHFDVMLVALTNISKEMEVEPGLKIHRLNSKRAIFSLPKLFHLFIKEKPKAVFSTLIQTNTVVGMLTPFFKDIKFYARETLIPSMLYQTTKSKFIPRLVNQFLYPNFDRIIFQSIHMKDDHLELFKADYHSVVINNFISIESQQLALQERNKDKLSLFTVARLNHIKQISHMLEAIKLSIKHRDIHLHIYGDGEERQKLEALTTELEISSQVTFYGFQNNPIERCKEHDALIMASKHEGFPNALLEALSIGKPVITYNSPGGIREIMQSKEFGKVVPLNDIHSLSHAIIEFNLSNYDPNLIQQFAHNRFGKDKIVTQYKNLVEERT